MSVKATSRIGVFNVPPVVGLISVSRVFFQWLEMPKGHRKSAELNKLKKWMTNPKEAWLK